MPKTGGMPCMKKLFLLFLTALLCVLSACAAPGGGEAAPMEPTAEHARTLQSGESIELPFVTFRAAAPAWQATGGDPLLVWVLTVQNTGQRTYMLDFGCVNVTFLLNGMYSFTATVRMTASDGCTAVTEYPPGSSGEVIFCAAIPEEIRESSRYYQITISFDRDFQEPGTSAPPEYRYEMNGVF